MEEQQLMEQQVLELQRVDEEDEDEVMVEYYSEYIIQ